MGHYVSKHVCSQTFFGGSKKSLQTQNQKFLIPNIKYFICNILDFVCNLENVDSKTVTYGNTKIPPKRKAAAGRKIAESSVESGPPQK